MEELDFWIGDWACTDPADGAVGHNSVRRVLDGRVVEETFAIVDASGTALRGRSWSVLDPDRGWLQTWVDNQGSYLDFTGGRTDEGFVFCRPGMRMVFRDVSQDRFTWDWEKRSTDDVWQLAWRLDYRRV
ncbi:MAG: tetratricopeptide repeat protein [Frankiales bacterium]|nr:tetratricopeptide repeat protein [Frankiales bacterium]